MATLGTPISHQTLFLLLLCFQSSSGDLATIKDVCQYTAPNTDLCVSTLSSDDRGATANRHGLAEIALDTTLVNASENVLYTHWLASKARGKWRSQGYRACLNFFNLTVVPHTLKAEADFHAEDYDNTLTELSYCLGYSQMCWEALKNLAGRGHTPPLRKRVELQMNLCEISQVLVTLLRYYN